MSVVFVVTACEIGQFTCIRDKSCTDIRGVCNGQWDCVDGSDELDCGINRAPINNNVAAIEYLAYLT